MEIGPKDTTFEVFIDGRRQGSLHISKGGIDWSPKMSNVKRYAKTWSQLRDFMEGDGEKAVEKEPSDSSSDDEDDEVIDSLDSLLRVLECDFLHEAEDHLREYGDTETDVRLFEEEHGVLRICTGGYGEVLTYPFHVGELWSVVNDMDTTFIADSGYETLASQIAAVEGFEVEVKLDYEDDETWVRDEDDRRHLDNGRIVQLFLGDYPYRRAMNGNRTITDWVATRFEPNYPGLEVQVPTDLSYASPLSDLRSEVRETE
jgi:diadenosine tetraphosphatase ApaH/serine/threonine PP2A family protein phosphatase